MSSILKSSPSGLLYYHGVTYKTTQTNLPAVAGQFSLPIGLTASSAKSLLVRFAEAGTPSTSTSCNGKYSSKNPLLTQIGFQISGVNYPQSGFINPLLYPAEAFRDLQIAVGSFNSTQYHTSILPVNYCVVSQGGTSSFYSATNQDARYTLNDSATAPSNFLWGLDLEATSKRGILNGQDLQLKKLQLVLQTASTPTNTHTVFVTEMIDTIFVINAASGDVISII